MFSTFFIILTSAGVHATDYHSLLPQVETVKLEDVVYCPERNVYQDIGGEHLNWGHIIRRESMALHMSTVGCFGGGALGSLTGPGGLVTGVVVGACVGHTVGLVRSDQMGYDAYFYAFELVDDDGPYTIRMRYSDMLRHGTSTINGQEYHIQDTVSCFPKKTIFKRKLTSYQERNIWLKSRLNWHEREPWMLHEHKGSFNQLEKKVIENMFESFILDPDTVKDRKKYFSEPLILGSQRYRNKIQY